MLLQVNLCKNMQLGISSYPALAVVLTHPEYNRIRYTGTRTLCAH